jgi:DNA-binding beta-propeller fold protein YncE
MRVTINSHLDTLEHNIIQELDDTEVKIKSKIDNLLKQLSKNSKTVEGLQSDIRAVKEYASDLQTFLGSKAIEEEVKKEEEYLMALSEDGCLQQLNLRYNINTKIKDILSTNTTFGSVSIETSPPSVVIKTTKAKQAQIMSVMQPPSVKSINDIKLTLHATFDIPKIKGNYAITGCIVSPNGKMIFVSYGYTNQRLNIINEDGTLDKVITRSLVRPFDITCLDDTTVAVSTNNGIEIINIDSIKTERRIQTSKQCRGITYHNGVLLWCELQRGIQMMQLSDDRVTTLVKQSNLSYNSYITTCGDKIYQTNISTVTCYTMKGEKLWEFKGESVLNGPHGVTVDNNSNVYVTVYSSRKVVVLEPDGRQGRQLISSEDGLNGPIGLYFDKSKNCLLVTNYTGPAFLYHMC